MKNFCWSILFLALVSCGGESSSSTPKRQTQETGHAVDGLVKLVTKGIPKGFRQRDYTMNHNGSISYSTIQLSNGRRSFILEIYKGDQAPALAPFSGQYNDLEAMFAPGDSLLLFASDRPTRADDTTRDFNLWYCKVKGAKLSDPIPFDTVVNTDGDEFYPCMNSRGDLYFTARYEGRRRDDIYVSRKTASGYEKPVMLSFCSGPDLYEFNAWVSPDDQLIIFSSAGRKNEEGGGDLFYSDKKDGNWQEPIAMGPIVNTKGLDFCPFVKGDTLFFTGQRIDKSWENMSFKYLSSIQRHADTTATGEQGIYIISLKKILQSADPAN